MATAPANKDAASKSASSPRRKRRLPFTKLLVYLAIAVAVVALVMVLRPKPPRVDVVAVDRGPLVVTLDEEGETRVRNRYVISAPIAGVVARIEIEPGDPVVRDETVLAIIEPPGPSLLDARTRAELRAAASAAEAAVGLARAERERANAELEFANAEHDRYRQLAAAEVVSTERLESAELAARTASEARDAAEYAVRRAVLEHAAARARLSARDGQGGNPIVLRAPSDGVLLRRLRESETAVVAGEPLVEIADLADLEIVADFLSTDAVRIRPGAAVAIERWGGSDDLHGTVQRIEPAAFTKISALGVEEQRVNVVVDFDDPKAAGHLLGDGYRVEVEVTVWSKDDIPRVPLSALFRDGDRWSVFTIAGDRARLRHVEIGARSTIQAELLDGLEPGEPVVLHPDESIEDGVRVRVEP